MSTYRLGLYFRELEPQATGSPICHVVVQTPLSYDYPDAKNTIFLTPREFEPETIGTQIDALITELQEIKTEVRRRYDEYKRKLRSRESSG